MKKRSKKAENSQHLHSTELKTIYSSNNKKIEINKIYYLEVSVIKIFFQNEKKIIIKFTKNQKNQI